MSLSFLLQSHEHEGLLELYEGRKIFLYILFEQKVNKSTSIIKLDPKKTNTLLQKDSVYVWV